MALLFHVDFFSGGGGVGWEGGVKFSPFYFMMVIQ